MEEVVDHSRVGTVLTNLQVKSGVHVHRHRFDSSTTLWPQFFEERPDRCSTATFTDPQHSSCIRIQHHARSEEHTSELQSLMRISYAVFCLKKKNKHNT